MSDTGSWRAGSRSRKLLERACGLMPGGVNSPVRAFRAVGCEPYFVDRAEGPYVWDVDGKRYIDYVASWGPLILGHAHPQVIEAVERAARRGTSYGAPHEGEVLLAAKVRELMPGVEMMRLTTSGTEATMSAARLARAWTERPGILKFAGSYHGHGDAFLIKAGSGAATFGQPDSPGVTPGTAADTLLADYNDLESVRSVFAEHGDRIAGVIVEPVAGNMGCVPPRAGFLQGLREICDETGSLLIFDEVMTGFRVGPGGAQQLYGVRPDLTTFGKIVGGGLPVGAFGGRRELMERISPLGPVYQAGTLAGNPIAVAAGLATLERLSAEPEIYDRLERRTAALVETVSAAAEEAGVPLTVNRAGSMFSLFFNPGPVRGWNEVAASDAERFAAFFRAALARGVALAPSAFECGFVSEAHGDEVIEESAGALAGALREAASSGSGS